jgi:hypothetical protein
MIYLDEGGFPVDRTGDGGDSAMRAGILGLLQKSTSVQKNQIPPLPIELYESNGLCVRCPSKEQEPWNSPHNFSRDQLIPLVAGLSPSAARRVFWSHAKRLFFCQNIERDVPGSVKSFWPHEFWKDSNPNSKTFRKPFHWRKLGFVRSLGESRNGIEERWFDYRDILMPDHIWHLLLSAKLWPFYWFALLGIPWLILSILGHSIGPHREHNQLICQCKVQGRWAVWLFKKLNRKWKQELRNYWGTRNEIEYAEFMIRELD